MTMFTPISPAIPEPNPGSQSFISLLSEAIQKLVVIFGPDITYARLSHIPEITFNKDNTIQAITGDHKQITQELLTLFQSLSLQTVESQLLPLITIAQASTARQDDLTTPKSPLPTATPYTSEKIFV